MKSKSKLPQGYYISESRLSDSSDSQKFDIYKTRVYVEEIDKYTNGLSKIRIIDIELISGFESSQYEHVKRTVRTKFSSIKNSSEITWLVSENEIKKERKEKLYKINNKNFIQRLFSK